MARIPTQFILKSLGVLLATGALVGYIFFETEGFRSGIKLTVNKPQNGASLTEPIAFIEGNFTGAQNLSVNGAPVLPDMDGNYSYPVILGSGYNRFDVTATDRFGRSLTKTIELMYNGEPPQLEVESEETSSSSSTLSLLY